MHMSHCKLQYRRSVQYFVVLLFPKKKGSHPPSSHKHRLSFVDSVSVSVCVRYIGIDKYESLPNELPVSRWARRIRQRKRSTSSYFDIVYDRPIPMYTYSIIRMITRIIMTMIHLSQSSISGLDSLNLKWSYPNGMYRRIGVPKMVWYRCNKRVRISTTHYYRDQSKKGVTVEGLNSVSYRIPYSGMSIRHLHYKKV